MMRTSAPPACCPPPDDGVRRRRIERRAEIALAAEHDRAAKLRVRAKREEQLLAADIVLAERRARAMECGIECLQDDIDHARRTVGLLSRDA